MAMERNKKVAISHMNIRPEMGSGTGICVYNYRKERSCDFPDQLVFVIIHFCSFGSGLVRERLFNSMPEKKK